MRRFYVPDIDASLATVSLTGEEHHHARNVLRLENGDEVSVFDGMGSEFLCRIAKVVKKEVVLSILREVTPAAPESPVEIAIGSVAIPGEKYDLIIQKSVELGIVTLTPLSSIRCELKLKDLAKKLPRWRRIALDASKQCGRARLMEITEPMDVREFVGSCAADHPRIYFSERDGGKLPDIATPEKVTAVIGPKGGWDDAELDAARAAGFDIVTLGGRIMRAETAAISLTAVLQHRFGDLN
ncbi:MAG: 16S rRNA (uracil(1498)-N(3))-methyltransferase [Pyrinomonadaceae bacterium]